MQYTTVYTLFTVTQNFQLCLVCVLSNKKNAAHTLIKNSPKSLIGKLELECDMYIGFFSSREKSTAILFGIWCHCLHASMFYIKGAKYWSFFLENIPQKLTILTKLKSYKIQRQMNTVVTTPKLRSMCMGTGGYTGTAVQWNLQDVGCGLTKIIT